MARRLTDERNDLGRQLTTDVGSLALTLPVVAREAFAPVVLPFVFVASITLVVLFATPFRDVPFVAQHAIASLMVLRSVIILIAFANLALPGYSDIPVLSGRWIISTGLAVMALAILAIDLRRTFPA